MKNKQLNRRKFMGLFRCASENNLLIKDMENLIIRSTKMRDTLDRQTTDNQDYFPARDLDDLIEALETYINRNK